MVDSCVLVPCGSAVLCPKSLSYALMLAFPLTLMHNGCQMHCAHSTCGEPLSTPITAFAQFRQGCLALDGTVISRGLKSYSVAGDFS